MTTIEILKENLDLKKTKFNTFAELIEVIEDLKFGQIISENKGEEYNIDMLKSKYLYYPR